MLGKWAQRRADRAERKSLERLTGVILAQMRLAQLHMDYRMLADLTLLVELVTKRQDQLGR
mgnify:CR=1 FL=1